MDKSISSVGDVYPNIVLCIYIFKYIYIHIIIYPSMRNHDIILCILIMIYHDINFEFHRYISMAARLQEVDSRVLKASQSALESVGSPWCMSTLD